MVRRDTVRAARLEPPHLRPSLDRGEPMQRFRLCPSIYMHANDEIQVERIFSY